MDKLYVSPNDLYRDALVLGNKVIDSGLRTDVLVNVMRGAALIGITIHELLRHHGISAEHVPIQSSTYSGLDVLAEEVTVQGIERVATLGHGRKILFVDDVFDRGMTYQTILSTLSELGSQPSAIGLAVVYYKPTRNRTTLGPDFYVHTTDKWLVFPHDLVGLTREQIAAGKGEENARLIFRDLPR